MICYRWSLLTPGYTRCYTITMFADFVMIRFVAFKFYAERQTESIKNLPGTSYMTLKGWSKHSPWPTPHRPIKSSSDKTIIYPMPTSLENVSDAIKEKTQTHSIQGFVAYAKFIFMNDYIFECTDTNCWPCNNEDTETYTFPHTVFFNCYIRRTKNLINSY